MTISELHSYKDILKTTFYADIFNDDIWGDMGIDTASISLCVKDNKWQLHYIRTQSGIPYILGDYVSNVIDEYTRVMQDDELYDYLLLHNLQQTFKSFVQQQMNF